MGGVWRDQSTGIDTLRIKAAKTRVNRQLSMNGPMYKPLVFGRASIKSRLSFEKKNERGKKHQPSASWIYCLGQRGEKKIEKNREEGLIERTGNKRGSR